MSQLPARRFLTAHPVFALVAVLLFASFAVPTQAKEPDIVVVQHVLISYKGRVKGKDITRSKKAAKELALSLYDRAVEGEDFEALVKEYTDDKFPGIYTMSNKGVAQPPGGIKRSGMVAKFGDTSFRLKVGEVGLATYNSMTSPYGWHIIKRLE